MKIPWREDGLRGYPTSRQETRMKIPWRDNPSSGLPNFKTRNKNEKLAERRQDRSMKVMGKKPRSKKEKSADR